MTPIKYIFWAVLATALPLGAASPTISPTATRTLTAGPSATTTVTPDWMATLSAMSWTPTPSPTASRTQEYQSPTATRTHSVSPTFTISPTNTITPTFTVSRTSTTTPLPFVTPAAAEILIDDLEDGDLSAPYGGSWSTTFDAGGSSVILLDAAGCPYATAAHCVRASGSCSGPGAGQYAGLRLNYSSVDLSAPAAAQRQLGFRAYSATPLTVTVEVEGPGGTFSAQVYLDGNGWQDCSVATPDHATPGDLPQLAGGADWAATLGACTGLNFVVRQDVAGTLPFDFRVDDLQWQGYPAGPSRSRLAAVFGVSLATVQAAYDYGLDAHGTWVLLVLSRRCGCHPSLIMAQRATMSWGQVAIAYGTTWADVLAEIEADAAAAGLDPSAPSMEELLRSLRNGTPSVAPLPTPTPYVPPGPIVLPPPGVSC